MARIMLVCDSMSNSIAAGQIIEPLKRYHIEHPTQQCTLITFERAPLSASVIEYIKQEIPFARFIITSRLPFFGQYSLYPCISFLRTHLQSYNDMYHIVARGPLAGFIALKAATAACTHITIQARSLLAEEYLFTHQPLHWYNPLSWWHYWRAWQLRSLEQRVYGTPATTIPPHTIEVVSHALAHYLTRTYHTSSKLMHIAHADIPAPIEVARVIAWRLQVRDELHIDQDAEVYCYNGSLKPWQCPEAVITFFKNKLAHNQTSVLLILTPDATAFSHYLAQAHIPATNYRVVNCRHHDIYRYLSAADYGIIFRTSHIINWTSRPTKVLEYQAVGLPIIHNNTIAMLVNNDHECKHGCT